MSGIDSDLIRGHIDTIILKSLYHGDKYGLEIIQEVEEKSGGTYELKQPTLYSCLKRLESQGLISSYWEDSDIGGKRHYYKLTEKGIETYKANQEEWLRSRAIIDNLIYNTTIDYAKIYEDKPGEEPSDNSNDNSEQPQDLNEEIEDNTNKLEENSSSDFLADSDENNEDEFANFENESTAGASFFDSNSEDSANDEFEEDDEQPSPILAFQTDNSDDAEQEEVVNLNLDENLGNDEPLLDESEEIKEDINDEHQDEVQTSNYYSATNLLDDSEDDEQNSENILDDSAGKEDDSTKEESEIYKSNDDDEIYVADNTSEDDQIYNPEPNVDYAEEQPEQEDLEPENNQEELFAPTYINFGQTENKEEADITNIQNKNAEEPQEASKEYNFEKIEEPDGPSIEETAASINEQFYSKPAEHASAEEINKLYQTTENYENLQAGYTDETYKQMLNELESYGGGTVSSAPVKRNAPNAMSFDELKAEFEKDGITVNKHERQLKESDDAKLYIKTNEINLIKNWIVWGTTSLALIVIFAILNSFKSTYSYDFGFWQFATAIAVSLVIPGYSTIRYFMNPYRKSIAKYAPRLNILINLLITIQLIVIVYCVNLQVGFYSFAQENYNHLLWIIPLVLTFIPILQSLTYMFLYNSKKFHI